MLLSVVSTTQWQGLRIIRFSPGAGVEHIVAGVGKSDMRSLAWWCASADQAWQRADELKMTLVFDPGATLPKLRFRAYPVSTHRHKVLCHAATRLS
jgi:hypothetical protein